MVVGWDGGKRKQNISTAEICIAYRKIPRTAYRKK